MLNYLMKSEDKDNTMTTNIMDSRVEGVICCQKLGFIRAGVLCNLDRAILFST